MANSLILGIDNSMDFLNLVLGTDEKLIEERHARAQHHSSQVLPVRVSELLHEHDCAPEDLTGLVVTLGPGSFTGVRVGLAFCKGFAEGLGIPLTGIPTPDVLAAPFAFMDGHYLLPLIDAKKGEVFFALYRVAGREVVRIDGFHSLKPGELAGRIPEPCLCFGSGVRLAREVLDGMEGVRMIETGFDRVSGEALLRCGLALRRAGAQQHEIKTVYGRKSDAEIKFNVHLS
jgi:tRNA threonylcarbamoyladenosine biosynthesis protein TsaB